MCILFVFSTFSSQIQWFFCHYHLTNRMNLMAGAMQCLAKSGASGVFFINIGCHGCQRIPFCG